MSQIILIVVKFSGCTDCRRNYSELCILRYKKMALLQSCRNNWHGSKKAILLNKRRAKLSRLYGKLSVENCSLKIRTYTASEKRLKPSISSQCGWSSPLINCAALFPILFLCSLRLNGRWFNMN